MDLSIDACARGEMIARRFYEIADNAPLISELFRAAKSLADEGRPEFDDDVKGVALAYRWILGDEIFV